MQAKTHLKINPKWWGTPLKLSPQEAEVKLLLLPEMAADEYGLIHGGTIFGLADYAAMLAVNEPNVVLAGAKVKFLKPCKVGQEVIAKAKVQEQDGKKIKVKAEVFLEDKPIFEGEFICVVPAQHVLAEN